MNFFKACTVWFFFLFFFESAVYKATSHVNRVIHCYKDIKMQKVQKQYNVANQLIHFFFFVFFFFFFWLQAFAFLDSIDIST